MITIKELCINLDIPRELIPLITKCDEMLDYDILMATFKKTIDPKTSNDIVYKELITLLGEDIDGIKLLTCSLKMGLQDFENYQKRGISEKIFIDTMKCFTRFLGESKASYGHYKFDRGWWTYRQLSLRIFRIGELEYELFSANQEKQISIHIPSDASFKIENITTSIKLAKEFMAKYFSEYENAKYMCSSWLLVPKLADFLSPTSNILQFQKLFNIESCNPEPMGFIFWIYNMYTTDYDTLPTNSSLQKALKPYIMAGGKIGVAKGYLKDQ